MNTEILFFSAPWCSPCKSMKSQINESVKSELNIRMIDITEHMDMATEFKVLNVPTFIKIIDGKEVSRKSGVMSLNSLRAL